MCGCEDDGWFEPVRLLLHTLRERISCTAARSNQVTHHCAQTLYSNRTAPSSGYSVSSSGREPQRKSSARWCVCVSSVFISYLRSQSSCCAPPGVRQISHVTSSSQIGPASDVADSTTGTLEIVVSLVDCYVVFRRRLAL